MPGSKFTPPANIPLAQAQPQFDTLIRRALPRDAKLMLHRLADPQHHKRKAISPACRWFSHQMVELRGFPDDPRYTGRQKRDWGRLPAGDSLRSLRVCLPASAASGVQDQQCWVVEGGHCILTASSLSAAPGTAGSTSGADPIKAEWMGIKGNAGSDTGAGRVSGPGCTEIQLRSSSVILRHR